MLINKSEDWNNLHNKISSQKFLNNILEKLKIEDKSFKVTDFFHKQNPGQKLTKYKSLHQKACYYKYEVFIKVYVLQSI